MELPICQVWPNKSTYSTYISHSGKIQSNRIWIHLNSSQWTLFWFMLPNEFPNSYHPLAKDGLQETPPTSMIFPALQPPLSAPSMASFHHPWHRRLSSRERRHRCWPEVSGNLWESMGIYGTAIANGWASIGISKSQWNTYIKLWSHSTSWGKNNLWVTAFGVVFFGCTQLQLLRSVEHVFWSTMIWNG